MAAKTPANYFAERLRNAEHRRNALRVKLSAAQERVKTLREQVAENEREITYCTGEMERAIKRALPPEPVAGGSAPAYNHDRAAARVADMVEKINERSPNAG